MKKLKFRGHIKNIEFSHIRNELKNIPEFSDFSNWKIKKLNVGEMHHTYIFSKGKKKYFIKEVKPHEAQINYFLSILKLKHLPYSNYPELLAKNILILDFIEGGMMKQKTRKIDLGLIRDFAVFQNKMNNREFFRRYNKFKINNFSTKNNGWLKGRFERNLSAGKINLLKLKKRYKFLIIDKYLKIAETLKSDENKTSQDFVNMPFARQHHDFREDNILGKKHKLIDWGSSYGYGPFMYDLCLFLFNNKAFNIFVKNSDIARKASKEQMARWIYVALADRFTDFCKWHLKFGTPNLASKSKLKQVLEYNYKTYRRLLDTS